MKYVLLILLISFSTSSLMAQQKGNLPFGYDLGIGVKAGLNFNKVLGEEWLQTYSTNPSVGFFAFVNKKHLGLQFEALWSVNTLISDTSFYGLYKQYYSISSDSLTEGTFAFHTISVPILLNYKLGEWVWLQAGPQFTSVAKVVDKDHLIKTGQTIVQAGELSGIAGIWLNIGKVGPIPRFNIGGRYIAGFTDFNALIANGSKWRNQRIQVHLGIGF